MPTIHVATHKRYVYGTYACESCGHHDNAAVFVRSEGSAQSNIVDSFDDSRNLAHGNAHQAAEKFGDEQIALAKCPKCGQRDELAVKNFRSKAKGFLGAGIFFAVLLAGSLGFAVMKGMEVAFVGIFLGVLFGLPALITIPIGLYHLTRKLPEGGVIFQSVDSSPWAGAGASVPREDGVAAF